jgi:hypothetical protein
MVKRAPKPPPGSLRADLEQQRWAARHRRLEGVLVVLRERSAQSRRFGRRVLPPRP